MNNRSSSKIVEKNQRQQQQQQRAITKVAAGTSAKTTATKAASIQPLVAASTTEAQRTIAATAGLDMRHIYHAFRSKESDLAFFPDSKQDDHPCPVTVPTGNLNIGQRKSYIPHQSYCHIRLKLDQNGQHYSPPIYVAEERIRAEHFVNPVSTLVSTQQLA